MDYRPPTPARHWPPRPGFYAEDALAHLADEAAVPALDPIGVALRQRATVNAMLECAAAIDRLREAHECQPGFKS